MGARLIDKQNASKYDLQMRAMCTLMICELKCDPVFHPMNVLAHRVCAKEPNLVIKQRSQVMSRGQYRLVTQKGRLCGLSLFVLLVSLYN